MTRGGPGTPDTVVLVLWGDLFEDFFDTIDVSLERFRTDLTGGWLFGYVDALAEAGVRTVLLTVSARVHEPFRFTHQPTGAPVIVLPVPRRYRRLRALQRRIGTRALRSVASYASLPLLATARELRRVGAKALLTQEYEHARFDVLVALGRLLRLPVFASFQGGDRPWSRLEALLRPFTARAAAGLVVAASGERQRVHRRYGVPLERIAPIPNAMDVSAFAPMGRAESRHLLGIGPSTRVVEWHGRVTIRRKGLDVLLDAWVQVCHARPDADLLLLLVGTGDDAAELHRRIDATGLDTIRWHDAYLSDRAELLPYPSAADIFVLPSRHEGFPVAPIEAMASGLPVVATDAPGVRDILPDGEASGGIVVPREDVDALAEALGALIDDEERCRELGGRARARALSAFSLQAVGEQLKEFLLER